MTDRELLEPAAKAIGLNFVWGFSRSEAYESTPVKDHPKDHWSWNPLTSIDDRYNMAKALRMQVDFDARCVSAPVFNGFGFFQKTLRKYWDEEGGDARAIVELAAEIGRAM